MVLAQEFYLYDYFWNVRVFYIVDKFPLDYIAHELESIGCVGESLENSLSTLEKETDSGVTFSNVTDRESIIIIGETTSPAEFQHSFDHEKIHLAMHIGKSWGIDPYGEELAYLVGDIGTAMFPVAKKFLCEHCRQELK